MASMGWSALALAAVLAGAPALEAQAGANRGQSARPAAERERDDKAQAQGRGQGQERARGESRGQGQQARPAQAAGQGQARGRADERAQGQSRGQGQQARPAQAAGQGQARGQQGRDQGQQQARPAQPAGQGQQRAQQGQARGQQESADRARGQGQGRAAETPAAGRPGGAAGQPERGRAGAAADARDELRGTAGERAERWVVTRRDGAGARPLELRVTGEPRSTQRAALAAAGLTLERRQEAGPGLAAVRRDDRRKPGDIVVLEPRQQVGTRAGAPAFCRSGAGHPVFGRQWCLDKGFGLGRDTGLWGTARMGDVILRSPDARQRIELNRRTLADVVGDVVFGRLEARRQALGATDPLTGRWLPAENGGHVLHVRSGAEPIAELVDRNGDGRVDLVLLKIH
jgi:hypothetical protein